MPSKTTPNGLFGGYTKVGRNQRPNGWCQVNFGGTSENFKVWLFKWKGSNIKIERTAWRHFLRRGRLRKSVKISSFFVFFWYPKVLYRNSFRDCTQGILRCSGFRIFGLKGDPTTFRLCVSYPKSADGSGASEDNIIQLQLQQLKILFWHPFADCVESLPCNSWSVVTIFVKEKYLHKEKLQCWKRLFQAFINLDIAISPGFKSNYFRLESSI